MTPLVQEFATELLPEELTELVRREPGVVLLDSTLVSSCSSRYSFVTARPMLQLRVFGFRCEVWEHGKRLAHFGHPWQIMAQLLDRYEVADVADTPWPLGGCFGFWGYELKNTLEPGLPHRAQQPCPPLPDCHVGFYSALVVFDRILRKSWIVSTGLTANGSRDETVACREAAFWRERLSCSRACLRAESTHLDLPSPIPVRSNLQQREYERMVSQAQAYIRSGHIYQVNLAQRFRARPCPDAWFLYRQLAQVSPAPYAAFLDCGDFQIASSSPELFLRLSGTHVLTRPIKGTRPRSPDSARDDELSQELRESEKERSELLMITDLLRNDLGKVCEYGSIRVPDLRRVERYAHVQHLVSTVEGDLRSDVTHVAALGSCFPGGSVTGAPKVRAMEIIDELEPVSRGPYTGALGYLGFNRESQLSILIRAAVSRRTAAWFYAGAGIVADSSPVAEYEETLAKARGFFEALERCRCASASAL
jgi:para-aminobenzoate synthetase component 1